MFRNYITTALRNVSRNKTISIIHIFGLALGMTCCFTILMYVVDEMSYDRWIPGASRIHRVCIDIKNAQGEHLVFAPASATLAGALKDYPQVEHAVRLLPPFNKSIPMSAGHDKSFHETNFFFADPSVFEVFGFDFLAGLPSTALQAPFDLVLTREMAEKYFSVHEGFDRLLGQTLKNDTNVYRVTAVIEDIPANSSFKPDFIANIQQFEGRELMENWFSTMFYTYVKLKEGSDAQAFEQQIRKVADKYVADELASYSQEFTYFLQPVTSIHLHSQLRQEFSKNNSYRYIQIFGLVAVLILVLACINFINLTTARAARRAKEVGVRKATGALRSQLAGQFLFETMVTSLAAAILALALVSIALPWFNQIADKNFTHADLWNNHFAWLLAGIAIITGFVAGSYPAFSLSGFRPAEVLRGSFSGMAGSKSYLRNGLVVAQFAISIALIIAMAVLTMQVSFLKKQHLGFAKEQLLVLRAPGSLQLVQNYAAVRTELGKLPGVNSVCLTGIVPGYEFGNNLVALKNDGTKSTDMRLIAVDEKFLETYQIPLVAGRNLSENIPEDLNDNVLINEAALPFYGWASPEEALGATFGGGWGTVVGVVKNFHFNSLHQEVLPLELYFSQRGFSYVTLNVATNAIDKLLLAIQSVWKSLLPATPFAYSFLDETFDRQYQFEDRLAGLFKVFGALAIFIACLGLFGLAVFTAEQRTKEIGIRKVLGASVTSVTGLLVKDFLALVILALALASPLSYFFMNNWLEDFAYRIEISWWVFALAGVVAVAVAFLTVSFQSVKAALANPVKSLRSE